MAAIKLKDTQLLPLIQGNVSVTSEGVVLTLEYTTQVPKQDRVVLQHQQHELDTVAGETHSRCGLMDQLNRRTCVHWLAWWLWMFKDTNYKLSDKDSHRFLNFAQLLAKQSLERIHHP